VSRRHYVPVPHLPGLRVSARPFARYSPTIGLCYLGPMAELISAGVASLEMLSTVRRGFDAAGDRYVSDTRRGADARSPQQRYRIWRWMKRVRALQMPGAREALAHAAAEARRDRQQTGCGRLRRNSLSATPATL
jgi:hypothetical protein